MLDVAMPVRTAERVSALELLLPDGVAGRAWVVGGSCPGDLQPGGATTEEGRPDLIVIALTATEARVRGWLEQIARQSAQALAPDGLLYVLAPALHRRRIRGLVRAQGLEVQAVLHVPSTSVTAFLVPLTVAAGGYAFSRLIPATSLARRLARVALRHPAGAHLLATLAPSVGLVARHPRARPLFHWLTELNDARAGAGDAVVRCSPHRGSATALVQWLPAGGSQAAGVVKLALSPGGQAGLAREAHLAERLGAAARGAGAHVPRVALRETRARRIVLVQEHLAGLPAAVLLAERPGSFRGVGTRVADWLLTWNSTTRVPSLLDSARLESEILGPAKLIAPLLRDGGDYLHWLEGRCRTVVGWSVPRVAVHGDLTMWNVILGQSGALGVVDWESAREDGLPLVDLVYALADGAAAARGYDRQSAFDACFHDNGACVQIVFALTLRAIRQLGIAPAAAEVCFHACWLQHAVEEQRRSLPGAERPFLEIVQALAAARASLGWARAIRSVQGRAR